MIFKSDYDTIRISNQFSPYSVQMKGDLHVPYLAYRVCGFSGSGRSYHISDQHLVCRGFPGRAGVQVCGGGLYPQLAVFVAVSFMLFLMVRPFAYKYLYGKRTKTNVDSLTGRKAVVKDRIDNVAGTGTAILAVRPGLPGRQRRGIPLKQVMWWLYPLSAGQSCW